MFVVGLQLDDKRIAVLQEMRMPTVVIGSPGGAGNLPAVWHDDAAAVRAVVGYLADLGHRRIARVTGMPRFWHTKIRTDEFYRGARATPTRHCLTADGRGRRLMMADGG